MFRTLIGGVLVTAIAAPVVAHHSFAMFDRAKDVYIEGEVKEFQFTNPHAYLQMIAPNGDDPAAEWTLELSGLNGLLAKGWRKDTLKPGDKIKVHLWPLRNGNPGGELVTVTFPDGTELAD